MGGLFSNLTKPNSAVDMPGGGTAYFPDVQRASQAVAKEGTQAVQPTPISFDGGMDGDVSANVGQAPNLPVPSFRTPSFRENTMDAAGNIKPLSQATGRTKLGSLMQILLGGAQGGLDAIQGGALDAPIHGESNFGKGLSAAFQMPQVREAQAQNRQLRQAQMSMLPWQMANQQANLDKTRSETAKNIALASPKAANSQDKVIDTYIGEDNKKHAVLQSPDGKIQDLVFGSVAQKAEAKDIKVGERVGPDNNKYVTFQKPDKTTYEVKVGAERPLKTGNSPMAGAVGDVSKLSPAEVSLVDQVGQGKMALNRLDYILARNPDLLAAVSLKYPDFDSSKVKSYIDTYKSFTGSGKDAMQLAAGATALRHLYRLKQIFDEHPVKARTYGTEPYVQFHNLLDTVADELMTFYQEPKTNEAIAAKKATLGALFNRDSAIEEQAQAMGVKFDELEQKWRNAAPSAAYGAPMPGISKEALDARKALDPIFARRMKAEGTAQPTPNPTAPATNQTSGGEWQVVNGIRVRKPTVQ